MAPPNKSLIEAYNKYSEKQKIEKVINPAGPIQNMFITFDSKEGAALAHMVKSDSILCTNILRTLKFNQEGIYSWFSNIIHGGDHQFECLLGAREAVDIQSLQPFKNSETLLWDEKSIDNVYVVVDEDKQLLYRARHLADCTCQKSND